MRAPRILIVDDDAGQRSLLDSFLRSQGFATTTANSGENALEILGREILGPLNINGFVPFDEHSYDEVRRVAAELGGAE